MHSNSVERLFSEGQTLSSATRQAIMTASDAAIPALRAIIRDRNLLKLDSRGEGRAPIHAATLLGELGAHEAIGDLLAVLQDTDPLLMAFDACVLALKRFGAATVEPTLAAITANPDESFVQSAGCLLSALGVRDERIYTMLVDQLDGAPDVFSGLLADYGDPRALELLSPAFERHLADETRDPIRVSRILIEMEEAIRRLGGELPADQRERFEVRRQESQLLWRSYAAIQGEHRLRPGPFSPPNRSPPPKGSAPPRGSPQPKKKKRGRNQPCWCGSGMKYKKCHLGR